MTSLTVKYTVDFGRGDEPDEPPVPTNVPTRLGRQLALAHHVERLVEDGTLRDSAEAARILGVTRARMSQIVNLLALSPALQERVLDGTLRESERELRAVVGEVEWGRQERVLDDWCAAERRGRSTQPRIGF